MKRKLLVFALLLTIIIPAILLTGCPRFGETPRTPDLEPELVERLEDYFPLTEGSTWQYLGEGNEFASFSREVVFTQGNRGQIREGNGGAVGVAVFETRDDAITRTFFIGEAYDNENYLDQTNENIVILQTPLEVGNRWETANGDREIVDVNATVETPAGTFDNCIQVQVNFTDSTLFEFYKEGIGLVKREFRTGDDFLVTSSLESYEIK